MRSRLLALVLLPMLCLAVLAGQQTQATVRTASAARHNGELTQAFLQVSRLRANLELERTAMVGLVASLVNGVDPAALSLLIGFDLVGAAEEQSANNDVGVVEVAERLERIDPALASSVRDAFAPRNGLAARALAPDADAVALSREVADAYLLASIELDTVGNSLRRTLLSGSSSAGGSGRDWDELRAHVLVAQDIADWSVAVADQTRLLTLGVAIGVANANDVYALGHSRITELETRARLLDEPLAASMPFGAEVEGQWEAARKNAADAIGFSHAGVADDATQPSVTGVADPDGSAPGATAAPTAGLGELRTSVDPIQGLADGLLASQLGKAGPALIQASLPAFEDVAGGATYYAEDIVEDSNMGVAVALGLLFATFAVCLAAAVLTTKGMTRPLRELAVRANEIRDGELPDAPLHTGGPQEVAAAAQAMNELTANLALLAQQAAVLGAGRLSDPVLAQSVPGPLGDSLRSSVTRLSELTDRLARQARRDPMTSLPNRVAIMERLEEALQRTRRSNLPVGLLFLDIDGFKWVNDSHGHEQGDAVLRVMAKRLQTLAHGERMAGRLGADEFVLVIEDADASATIMAIGEELVRLAQEPIELSGQTFRLSASIGAVLSHNGHDASTLLRDANQASEAAKRHGKGRVRAFDPTIQQDLERRARIEYDLRRAIVEDEFVLYLQPVIETATGRVEGAEALIRWCLEDGTVVPPNDFIPVAEESSLIVEIGRIVIDKACRQLAAWEREGLAPLHLAINVGGRHVTEGTLVRDINLALTRHGVHPERLVVELTESNLVTDLDIAAQVLGELRALGVRIALDDFGTGYSSLTYLRQLPIDTMKLDRSYVNGLGSDEQETSIVESLMQLAGSLTLDVVAEGVETPLQLDHLRRLGCRSVQGYLLARPMPTVEFGPWLGTRQLAGHPAGASDAALPIAS